MGLLWPVPGYYFISSGFTDQRSYGMHVGIDIPAPAVPTIAIGDGTVIYMGWAGSAGRSVYLQLDTGWRVHYCHLDTFLVTQGQVVGAGDVIGYVGGSGYERDNYFGSHLHLNLFKPEPPGHYVSWVSMWAVDPELYLGKEDEVTDLSDETIQKQKQANSDVINGALESHLKALDAKQEARSVAERTVFQEEIARLIQAIKDR